MAQLFDRAKKPIDDAEFLCFESIIGIGKQKSTNEYTPRASFLRKIPCRDILGKLGSVLTDH